MIPPEIGSAIILALVLAPLAWLALRWAGRAIQRRRARLVEPETHGDDGGWPRDSACWDLMTPKDKKQFRGAMDTMRAEKKAGD